MTDTTSTTINRILPKRLPNSAYRVREYLTEKEVDRLIEAAKRRGRNDQRDAAAILLAYRHGLRATELCSLRWSQIDLRNGRLHVNRAKGGRCTDLNCEQSTARYTALAPDRFKGFWKD
jgi:integrase